MSGRASPVGPSNPPIFQTPYKISAKRPFHGTDGEPPPQARKLFEGALPIHTHTIESLYPPVSPLIKEQLECFEARAPYYLNATELQEARNYINELLRKPILEEVILGELAMLRYYIDRDHSFTKPEEYLIFQRIHELLQSARELQRFSERDLPSGIPYMMRIVLARILILPSGTPNLIAGARALQVIANDDFIPGIPETFERIRYLCKDILGSDALRKLLEESAKTPIHENLHDLVRWSLCLGENEPILPHYGSWLILADFMNGTRQSGTPDCAVQALHRAASANPHSRLKIVKDYCRWLKTGSFIVNDQELPIDIKTIIPFLSFEPSIDRVEVKNPENPVLQLVAQVIRRQFQINSPSPMRLDRLATEPEQRAFEAALAGQRESFLSHLNMFFHALSQINRPDDSQKCSRFHFLVELIKAFFASLSPQLKQNLFEALEKCLFLFDHKHEVRDGETELLIDERYSSRFTVKLPKEELRRSYQEWLANCRIFYRLNQGKWEPLDTFPRLQKAVEDAVDEAYGSLKRTQKLETKKAYSEARKKLITDFSQFVVNYITRQLRERGLLKEEDAAPQIGPFFMRLGLYATLLPQYYSKRLTFIRIEAANPLDLVCRLATRLKEPLRSSRMVICANQSHAMTMQPATFPIPSLDPAGWIKRHMTDPAEALLKKPIPPEIVDFIQSGMGFDIKSAYSSNPGMTYQQMKDHLLAIENNSEMQACINWAFHQIPTGTVSHLIPENKRELLKSKWGPSMLANGMGSMASFYLTRKESDKFSPDKISNLTLTPQVVRFLDPNYANHPDNRPIYYAACADLGGDPDKICFMRLTDFGTRLEKILPFDQFRICWLYSI